MQSPGIGGFVYEKRLKETFIGHKKWIMELSERKTNSNYKKMLTNTNICFNLNSEHLF